MTIYPNNTGTSVITQKNKRLKSIIKCLQTTTKIPFFIIFETMNHDGRQYL